MGVSYKIYCHSPRGVTAAAIGDRAFYTIYAHHHTATLQQPWRSLRCLLIREVFP